MLEKFPVTVEYDDGAEETYTVVQFYAQIFNGGAA